MKTPFITSLTIYPVKSMGGIELQSSRLDNMGFQWDRRWMLVDETGEFVTARKHPQLLCIQPEMDQKTGTLSLHIPDQPMLGIPQATAESPRITVTVWNDQVEAIHLDTHVDQVLSNHLGTRCKMVFFDDKIVRQVDQDYASPGDRTGFSDGFPLLLISKPSLDDLNSRMDTPLPMKRFRPNIVVDGCEAYEEDNWQQFTANSVTLAAVKPCSRCIMTTANPETGKREGKEPLKTLETYRKQGNKVMFGQNIIHQTEGTLKVGDSLNVTLKP